MSTSNSEHTPRASLDLTHVLYDSTSITSLLLALLSLSPILLMPAYAALAVQTRELTIIIMWAGQLACEGLNWALKRAIRQERPEENIGNGYGFPSSHSQWMGYFASFLILHFYFRHRFATTKFWVLDRLIRACVYLGLCIWAGLVCFSRYHLTYHTPPQILWGFCIGIIVGSTTYISLELIPTWYPESKIGRLRRLILDCALGRWVRLRDGWAVWEDGGREDEWARWRAGWERKEGKAWRETKRKGRGKNS